MPVIFVEHSFSRSCCICDLNHHLNFDFQLRLLSNNFNEPKLKAIAPPVPKVRTILEQAQPSWLYRERPEGSGENSDSN